MYSGLAGMGLAGLLRAGATDWQSPAWRLLCLTQAADKAAAGGAEGGGADNASSLSSSTTTARSQGHLQFQGVHFAYPAHANGGSQGPEVLSGVDLEVSLIPHTNEMHTRGIRGMCNYLELKILEEVPLFLHLFLLFCLSLVLLSHFSFLLLGESRRSVAGVRAVRLWQIHARPPFARPVHPYARRDSAGWNAAVQSRLCVGAVANRGGRARGRAVECFSARQHSVNREWRERDGGESVGLCCFVCVCFLAQRWACVTVACIFLFLYFFFESSFDSFFAFLLTRYGRLDASDDDIIAAAEAANAHGFIMQLPQVITCILSSKARVMQCRPQR